MTSEDPIPATEPATEPMPDAAPSAESTAMDEVPAETVTESVAESVAETPPVEPTVPAEPAAPKPKRVKKEKPAAEPEAESAAPAAVVAPETDSKKKWYVVKVASGQEDSIKARLERKIKVESLEQYIAQIVIPVERVTEIKKTTKKNDDGEKVTKEKRVIKERKKYPGYLMAEVEFNDQVLYLFRETPGVGDFVGGGPGKPPAPMTDYEVQRMLGNEVSVKDGGPQKTKPKLKVKIDLERGDKVRLRDGAFAGTEGEVLEIAEAKDDDTPKITVKVQFWGRDVKIDNLEFWQVDKV
jgi:transcription termination/antitermination protein NusG